MKKYGILMVALLATAAFVAPAFAEFKVNGYYRTQGIATNSDDSSIGFDGPNTVEPKTQNFVDARLRAKISYMMNDKVTLVHYSEVDALWGDAGKDGGPGGDRVGIETKNLYLNVKEGNFDATVGLQGLGDRYEGLVIADDWSAAKVAMAMNADSKLTLVWSKPSEGTSKSGNNDTDLYWAAFDTKAGDISLGFDAAWLAVNEVPLASAGAGDSPLWQNSNPFDLYILGAKLDAGMINGFVVYAMGEEDIDNGSDLAGYAASVALNTKAGDAKVGARLLYLSGDDGTDADQDSFIPNLGGNYDLAKENLMLFYTDAYYNNGPGGRLATNAATVNGHGLIGLSAKADTNFGDYYGKFGVGYFMAADTPNGVDDQYGAEVAARVGRKLAEKVDVSLAAAYGMLGDYWEDVNGLTDSPDDIWKLNFMLNVPF